MASQKKGAVPSRQSSFGAMAVAGKSVPGKSKGNTGTASVKPKTTAAMPVTSVKAPVKITSKAGYDRETEKKFELMLAGDLDDLPHLPRSIVRIFLSSTFSDMRAERNMLARMVYPELRGLCANLELDFQVIDLRWGLTAETENDHSGTKVCLQEIKNCQDVSLGPNFVSIIGHRYGMHRPLVPEIAVKEFEILLADAKSLNLPDVPVVEKWYMKDENALPPVYVLQPIKANYPHYGDMTPGKEEQRRQDLERWTDTDKRLRCVLQTAANSAYKAKKISEQSWRQHFMSVTDHEIMGGIVHAKSPSKHTACFQRELTGLNGEALTQNMAHKYIDTVEKDGKPQKDKETEAMITDLIKKVRATLGKKGIIELSTLWKEGGIDPQKFPEHEEYITQLCCLFLERVADLISEGIDLAQAKIRQREWYTPYNEAVHHLRFCNTKCESFCGQDDVLKKAKEYILDPSMRKPFIIHAPSGAGKTSVMAMIMKKLKNWLPSGYTGMIRFLGTSPLSLHVYNVLFSVCGQLADNADIIMERISYLSWNRLKSYAPRLFRRVSSKLKKPTIILLDSLDQLAPSNEAYSMEWLPVALPSNIKIIVSTLPEEHGILDNLKKLVPDLNCYCAVPLLPQATGQQIVRKYLQLRNRTTTEKQMNIILEAFQNNPRPLYLKLLMDNAVKYQSFQVPDPSTIPGSIRLAISALYDELELKFGRCVVQSALGLLTVGLNGLSDIEVEDALSCCDQALDEVYVFHDPPVPGMVRIPPVLWARIRYELREYLVERLSQGKTTLFWYHRQFIEAATERYTTGENGAALHAVLFEMFSAEKGVKKSICLRNRKNLTVKDADRQTTPQPLSVNNTRKLECMPYHLLRMKNLVSPDVAKTAVFTNFQFLSTKLSALGVDKVLEDFSDYLSVHRDAEVIILKQFIQSQKISITSPRSFAFYLLAHLSVASSLKHLQILKSQAEAFLCSSDKPLLIPCMPCLAARPGDPSLVLNGFTRVLGQSGESILVEKESVDEEVSNFAIVNVTTSEVTDVLLESSVAAIRLTSAGQGYAYLTDNELRCKKLSAQKEESKSLTDIFKGSKVVPRTTESMKMSVSGDGCEIGLFAAAQSAIVNLGLGKSRLPSVTKFSNYTFHCLLPLCVDSSSAIVSGDISHNDKNQSFIALWKSGDSEQGVIELDGLLLHSLLSLTAEEQFVVSVLSQNDSHSLVIVDIQSFTCMPSVSCGHISQLQVSSTQQVVAVLSCDKDIHFIDVSTSAKLQTVSHKTAVSMFDVVWEEDHVVVADSDGQITIYARSGSVLLTYLGHSQGVSYLTCVGESITILACTGVLKAWDASAVSLMLKSSSGSAGDGQLTEDSQSLSSQTNVINIMFNETGKELFTFTSDGVVDVWDMGSLQKVRSLSIGLSGDVVHQTAFSCAVVLDKEQKLLKLFQLDTGNLICEDIIPKSVMSCTMSSDRRSILLLSEQPQLTLHKADLDGKTGHVTKTLRVNLGFNYVTIDMMLSASERYLALQVKIPKKDYEAVEASWKKGKNLPRQCHPYRFAAVDLNGSTGHALQCYRPLTKIPHLGVGMEVYSGNTILLASRRWFIFWDIPTGKCDQRMSKSARKTMFYRPDWVKAAAGANICTAVCPGNHLLAAGSEDGYMFVYENESGMPVGMKAPATKHQAPVCQVCFTPDKKTVLSVCHNGVVRMWMAATATQLSMMELGSKVRCMQLSQDGSHVVALTETERSRVAVFRLHRGKT